MSRRRLGRLQKLVPQNEVYAGWLASLNDPASRGWVVLTGGSLARLAIGFVASVVIARAFGPADLGIYATLAALAATVGALAEFGLTESAVRRVAIRWSDDQGAAAEPARAYFWLRLGLTSVVVLVAICLIPVFSALRLLPATPLLTMLALLGIIAIGVCGAVSGLLQATGRFGRLSLVMMTNAVLTAVLAVLLRLTGLLTIESALVILGIGTAVICAIVGWKMLPLPLLDGRISRQAFRREASELLRFGRWLWLANTLAMLAVQLDLILAGHMLQPIAVGAYALAVGLASKANVVNQSLHAALLPFASSLRSREALRTYLRRGIARSLVIAAILVLALPLARPLIPLVFGASYESSVGLFQALLGVAVIDVLAAPVLLLAYTADRPRLIALADALRVAALLLVALLLIPAFGATGLIIAKLVASLAGLGITVALLLPQFRSEGILAAADSGEKKVAIQIE